MKKITIIIMMIMMMVLSSQTVVKANEDNKLELDKVQLQPSASSRAVGKAVKTVVISDKFSNGEFFKAQMDITYTYNDNNNFSITGIVQTYTKLISGPSEAYVLSAYAERVGTRKFHVVMIITPFYGGVPYYGGVTVDVF